MHPEDRPAYIAAEERRKASREPYALEYRITHPGTGEPRGCAKSPGRSRTPGAGCTYLDSYILDITEQKLAEAQIRHLALHDPLTGLPNRALFHDRLGQALAHAKRRGGRVALLLLDLNRFKEVNDAFGHDAGDALLREVTGRLARRLRGCDTAGRIPILILPSPSHPIDAQAGAWAAPTVPFPDAETPPSCSRAPTSRFTRPRPGAAGATCFSRPGYGRGRGGAREERPEQAPLVVGQVGGVAAAEQGGLAIGCPPKPGPASPAPTSPLANGF